MSDQDNTDFIKELERKSAFGMWQDYCDMKEQLTETEQALSGSKAREGRYKDALLEAIDCISDWGSYASPYFQEKHDLQGDMDKLKLLTQEERSSKP